jgi:hypothetical protein
VVKLLCSCDSHDLFVKILEVLVFSGVGILLDFWSVLFLLVKSLDFRNIEVDFGLLGIFISC